MAHVVTGQRVIISWSTGQQVNSQPINKQKVVDKFMYVLTAMDMMSIVQNIVLQCAKSEMIIVQNLIKNMTRYELLFFFERTGTRLCIFH